MNTINWGRIEAIMNLRKYRSILDGMSSSYKPVQIYGANVIVPTTDETISASEIMRKCPYENRKVMNSDGSIEVVPIRVLKNVVRR